MTPVSIIHNTIKKNNGLKQHPQLKGHVLSIELRWQLGSVENHARQPSSTHALILFENDLITKYIDDLNELRVSLTDFKKKIR